tara:strand:- start:277 stop:456 length:180 start_codon:yes stop_codon:yes gene_type:complete
MIDIIQDKCDFCGACIGVCPPDCIDVKEASISINHETCIDCNLCVYICPIEVLKENNEG